MRGALRRQFGGLPRAFWVLWTATLVNRAGNFVVVLLALYLSQERHLEPSVVGLVLGLFGGGSAVGAFVGGHLADRWGRRHTLLLAQLGATASLLFMAFAGRVLVIATAAVLIGMFQNMARPAYSAMLIDVVPSPDRMRALNLNYWAINLGFTVAALAGGLLASFDFTLVFVINAATTLVGAVLVFVAVPESRPERHPHERDDGTTTNPYRDRVYLGLLLTTLLTGIVFAQNGTTLPMAMGDAGFGPEVYGAVIAVNGILIVAGQLFMPALVRRHDLSNAIAFAAILTGVGFALTAIAGTPLMFALTVVIWTLGEMVETGPKITLNAELSPVHARGRYQGAMTITYSVASFIAPIAGGAVFQVNPTVLWLGCLVVCLVAAGINIASRASRNARVAELTATAS